MKNFICALLVIAVLSPLALSAAKKDSTLVPQKPYHKNIIKLNPTPMILWSSKNLTLSYERILGPKQSVAIAIGYLEFPSLFKDTIVNLVAITSRSKYGLNLSLEYRFYMWKRNGRPVPDGLFFAPFASFYGYHFENGFDILHAAADSAGKITGKIGVINAGLEMGYQFVFWKRLTVDLVLIGPAMSYYSGTVNITGQIDAEKVKELHEDLYNKLKEKYPMIGDYVVNKSFSNNGKLDLFSVGFRYLVQIGFHF
jgi:hypothetical protein